ncbi:hypothetical protein EDB89DRAFT_1910329 [Lactarius sanguifluus]|nr:hypothetical protein EDB89DRAFT_1910329 [Lactarius sanguifluus]
MCLPDDTACLERLRSQTVGRLVKDMMREELDQELELNDDLNLNMDLDIDDEDVITARIQDFLDESDDILCAKDHKQRKRIFRAIHNSKIEVVLDDFIDKLHDEWERDHAKKAESKRLCELKRIAAATDPFTLKKKRGKKARKTARQAGRDLGSAPTLSLPLMAQHAHKLVHELAHAFSLKSKSVGNGAARFSKFVRRMFDGVRVDERNVARIWSSRRRRMGAVVQWKKVGERSACGIAVVTG